MKRRDLIRHLEEHGCVLVREGSKHSIYASESNGLTVTIPRHREIKKFVAAAICEALDVPPP